MIRVFCDFDGTTATEDVGNRLFQTFGGHRSIDSVEKYFNGEIDARRCLEQECECVESLTKEQLAAFLDQFTLDPCFRSFVEFCRLREMPLVILSDGLDFYIEHLLRVHDLHDVKFYANHLEFDRQGSLTKLVPSFPYTDAECLLCGNCKRNHMLTQSGDEDVIVYVGDGISDRCPVRYADIIFAKKDLIKYCQEQNITYFEYRHFGDVQRKIEQILSRRRIKTRREAGMARREAFMQG